MNASEVRTIESHEALVVSGNRQPIKLQTTPYFENWKFKRQARKGACDLDGGLKNCVLEKVSL